MASEILFAAISCTHAPLTDMDALEWACTRLSQIKPDVLVHLGDLHEMASASKWPSEYDWTLADEYRFANQVLAKLRKASGAERCVFLPGNHDDNLYQVGRVKAELRGLVSWREPQYETGEWLNKELLTEWDISAKYEYCRRNGVFRIGQVTFGHGFEAAQNADEFHSINLGCPYGLYIGGHTHRPCGVTQAMRTQAVPLPYWYCNAGTLGPLKPPYMARKRTQKWGQGLVWGKADPNCGPAKSLRMTPKWTAEVEIFRMGA